MFSLISSISPKFLVLRLTDTQQQLPASAAASQVANQPMTSFNESVIYNGKQGGGATVLGEGVTL
jgi:hypothetical protein